MNWKTWLTIAKTCNKLEKKAVATGTDLDWEITSLLNVLVDGMNAEIADVCVEAILGAKTDADLEMLWYNYSHNYPGANN